MKYTDVGIIGEVLCTVLDDVSRYNAQGKSDQYAVWAEDGEGTSVEADNKKVEQTFTGTIDYFTRSENDPNVQKIQDALSERGISFFLSSIQIEDETEPSYIHYEWIWEV